MHSTRAPGCVRGCQPPERVLYTHDAVSVIVLIAPASLLDLLRTRLDTHGRIQSFTEHEVREAVEYIATARPPVVAIDEVFAVSTRGEALIGRITDDPELGACEIRILAREPRPVPAPETVPVTAGAAEDVPAPRPAFDRHGTRRVERVRLIEGVAVTVDGSPAELVDLSSCGAQLVSRIVLRPNQRVRLSLPEGTQAVRCGGAVVWASFEMPSGLPPRYRAGLRLSGIDGEVLEEYADRYRAPSGGPG